MSLPGWLDEILRWFARPKTVTHRIVLDAAAGNPTRDHGVASPTPSPLYCVSLLATRLYLMNKDFH